MTAPIEMHIWHACHGCGGSPIIGRRYDCRTCPAGPDNHLCAKCYDAFRRGALAHPPADSFATHSRLNTGAHEFTAVDGRPGETYATWLAVADRFAPPPTIAGGFVVRPEFCAGGTSFLGSYAFVLRVDGLPSALVITALHVLDELARTLSVDCSMENASYTGEELPRLVDQVNLYDVFVPNWMQAHVGTTRSMLVLNEARTGEVEPSCQRDVAAFLLDEDPRWHPARLAAAMPAVGQPVWLVASGGRARPERTVAATVVERTDDTMIFRYGAGVEPPRHSSGAPLVNAAGEVVGINIGAGTLDGHHYGHAHHADNMRRHLAGALALPSAGHPHH